MNLLNELRSALLGLAFGWVGLFLPPSFRRNPSFYSDAGNFLAQQIAALVLVDFRRPKVPAWATVSRPTLSVRDRLQALTYLLRAPAPNFLKLLWPYSVASLSIAAMGLSGVFYFGSQVASAHSSIPAPATISNVAVKPPPKIINKFMPRSVPMHLNIARIGVSVDLIGLGRLPDGTMEVPPLFSPVAGWYNRGPSPGEQGPAVIVGHVDTYKGPSVFWRLYELRPGDTIEVTRADKRVAVFKVEALKQFEKDSFPTKEVYGNLDYAGLRLITCGGTFNPETVEYTQNTVVFASLVL